MLKHIFRHIKLQNPVILRINNVSTPLNLSRFKNFHANLKNVRRNIYTGIRNNSKLFYESENAFAYSIISKEKNDPTITSHQDVKTQEEFDATLNQNWRESSASEIVKAFTNVKDYSVKSSICISDTRFDKLVDGLMDHCESLTNTEIIELLSTLAQYPPCESYSSHNFHDIWSCLDDICCWKMAEWDIEMCFTIANLWYKLNLGKLCDFIYVLVDRLTKKADNLTKDQLVSVFFYFNVCRKRAVDFEYEYALQKHMNSMSIDEIAVISMGYFKTRTKIKLLPIMETIVQKVKENSKTIHEISLTAILKIIRYSKPTKIIIEVRNMLDVLGDEIHRLSSLCCLHIALIGTGLQFPHIKTLQEVSEKLLKDIRSVDKIRLKDIERLLNVLTMFDFDPKTEPDIYKAAFDELHRTDRQAEYIKYPRCLPCALYYLSMRNIYSYKLMDKVLDIEFIKEIFGKGAKLVPLVIFSLDVSIDVECPDYKGKRLPLELRHKAAKWLTDFAPEHEQPKKITAADKLFLDTVDTIKEIVKDEKLMYIDHVLPHFSRADIILCKDKETGKFIQPRGFENYILGDVMFPLNDGSLQWLAVVILGWNNTFRESSLPLGNIIMKERQLKKIGYTPVFVIWYEFMSLSREDQIAYVSKKIN